MRICPPEAAIEYQAQVQEQILEEPGGRYLLPVELQRFGVLTRHPELVLQAIVSGEGGFGKRLPVTPTKR